MLQHGADVNGQVTGTKTYSMRISLAPSSNEGMTALHIAAQSGNVDVVKFLINKGANTGIVDGNGRKPIDWQAQVHRAMVGGAECLRRLAQARRTVVPPPLLQPPGRAANAAEIRAMLTNAGSDR